MYNNALYHAGKHKYIAKVKVGRKTRYFYSQKEYDAYLAGRNDQVNVANAAKNGTVPYQTKTRTMTDQEKRNADARREYAKKTGDYSDPYGKKPEVKTVAQMRQEKAGAAVDAWRKDVATVKRNQEAAGDKVVNDAKKQLSSSVDTWRKNVATVKRNQEAAGDKVVNDAKKQLSSSVDTWKKNVKSTAKKGADQASASVNRTKNQFKTTKKKAKKSTYGVRKEAAEKGKAFIDRLLGV